MDSFKRRLKVKVLNSDQELDYSVFDLVVGSRNKRSQFPLGNIFVSFIRSFQRKVNENHLLKD